MDIKALNEIIRGRSESNNKEEADLAETLGKMTEAAEAAKSSLKFANLEAARLRAALKTCEELGAKMYRNEIDASAAFECTQCELTLERSSTLIPCGHKFCFLCFDETEKDAKGLTKCPACGQSATAVVADEAIDAMAELHKARCENLLNLQRNARSELQATKSAEEAKT